MYYTQRSIKESSKLAPGDLLMARLLEANLPWNDSHDALRSHVRKALMEAVGETDPWNGPYVMDMFSEHVVYQHKGKTYKRKYKMTPGVEGEEPSVSFVGAAKPVHVAYVDTKSSEALGVLVGALESVTVTVEAGAKQVRESVKFDPIPVREGAASPLIIPVKVIEDGWGASAFYPKEVLKKDGPAAFPAGTLMMMNHATDTEEAERPEGDYTQVAGVLVESATWRDSGPKGPGLYAKAKVFSDYSTQVVEKGPYTGLSINASIRAEEGEREGRKGLIATAFLPSAFNTIDFVTRAGAGGAPVVPVSESARDNRQEEGMIEEEKRQMDSLRADLVAANTRAAEAEAKKIAAEGRVVTLEANNNKILAIGLVSKVLREAEIKFSPTLVELACSSPVMKDGKLDEAWVGGVVEAFLGDSKGRIKEAGHGKGAADEPDDKDTKESIKNAMKSFGVPEAGLEIALRGGVQ
jgi:hypothetical protein